MSPDHSPTPAEFQAALEDYARARHAGEALDPTVWLERYPHLASALRHFLSGETRVADPDETGPYFPPVERGPAEGPVPAGYEILGTLGRGGMGVVYKARQVKAQRVVALKMIRAGELADDCERERFQTEGQALAALDHPHIVKVFDVGDHTDPGTGAVHPYFALEFCPHGSLADRLRQSTLAPREAAELVEKLAGAMALAHDHAIIHRDLKPANILLADSGHEPGESLLPRITDFGLAKRLGSDSGQTHQGAILGTPSYMAPEQALGRTEAIGPACDIYALGAILYECLTGKPPFKGQSVQETLEQVRTRDPLSPRQLNPGVPRDLETICLKCLRKEPGRRYSDARALADDLRRWLNGQPIRARPVGTLERTLKWCRRNPALTAFLLALVLGIAGTTTFAIRSYVNAEAARENARVAGSNEKDAQRQARLARETLSRMLDAQSETLASLNNERTRHLPGSQEARLTLCRNLADGAERLHEQWPYDEAVHEQAGRIWLQAGLVATELQSETESLQLLQRAESYLRDQARRRSKDPAARMDLAEVLLEMGGRLRRSKALPKALAACQESVRLLTQAQEETAVQADAELSARVSWLLGRALLNEGKAWAESSPQRLDLAIQQYERALKTLAVGADRAPRPTPHLEMVVLTAVEASHLLRAVRKPEPALLMLDLASSLLDQVPAEDRERPPVLQQGGNLYNARYLVLSALNRDDEALSALGRAVEIRERLHGLNPAVVTYMGECGTANANLAGVLVRRNQTGLAVRHYERAFELLSRNVAASPEVSQGMITWTMVFRQLVQLYRNEYRWVDASTLCRRYATELPPTQRRQLYFVGLENLLTAQAMKRRPDAQEPQEAGKIRLLIETALVAFEGALNQGFSDGERFQKEVPWQLLRETPGGEELLRKLKALPPGQEVPGNRER